MSRFVVQQQIDDSNKEGQQPATVIQQVKFLFGGKAQRLSLLVGGYRNKQASILERRHEVFILNHGWERHTAEIRHLVKLAVGYRDALYKAIYVFVKGIKDMDAELLLEAMLKNATVSEGRPHNSVGRAGIDFYNALGYVPYNVGVNENAIYEIRTGQRNIVF